MCLSVHELAHELSLHIVDILVIDLVIDRLRKHGFERFGRV